VQHQRVCDLVDPVGQPEGDAGEDDVEAPALDLLRVNVENEREQRDRVPLERRGIAQDVLGGAGEVRDGDGRSLWPADT
jgi:hypothetical protein